MMMADRVGSPEATALLTTAGAKPFDPKDLKVKAALVRIDASLLHTKVDEYHIMNGGRTREKIIDFARLETGSLVYNDIKWE